MIIVERVFTCWPPMSGGSIMVPAHRQVPAELWEAAARAGSGFRAGGPAFFWAARFAAPVFCARATLGSTEGASGFFSCAPAASEAVSKSAAIRTIVVLLPCPTDPYQS